MALPAVVVAYCGEDASASGPAFANSFIIVLAHHSVSRVDGVVHIVAVHIFHYSLKMERRAVKVGEMKQLQGSELPGVCAMVAGGSRDAGECRANGGCRASGGCRKQGGEAKS